MASAGELESTLGPLPKEVKTPLVNYTRAWIKRLRFGAPSDVAVAAENFGGHLVPFTTSATPDQEVAIPHLLGRVPRVILSGFIPADTVNATIAVLTQTRAADMAFLYLSSPTASASVLVYVE